MELQQRIGLAARLGEYMSSDSQEWLYAKECAARENPWFIPSFIELAAANISREFLSEKKLLNWAAGYALQHHISSTRLGIVMAGNIPLVGFHDLLCGWIAGIPMQVKPSSKDRVLIEHLVEQLIAWDPRAATLISFADNLKGCDAYIATGSNNSSRYFEYYFGKYPSIIRRNRTSVAILDGSETVRELELLADDIQLYFGLGCRNVTKIYVPLNYDFLKLLDALRKYDELIDFHKYKHNYDYQLALQMMSNKFYMTNGSVILAENSAIFSPVSQVNYEYYSSPAELTDLPRNPDIQCIAGHGHLIFGCTQSPSLLDYADGIDTMQFLTGIGTH